MKSIPERETLSPHVNTWCFKIQYQVHSPPSLLRVPWCISVTEQIWRQFLKCTRLSQSQTMLTLPLDENQSDSSWVKCTRGNRAIAKWAWSRIFRKLLWWNSWSIFYDSFSIKRLQARPVLQSASLLHLSRVVSDFTRKNVLMQTIQARLCLGLIQKRNLKYTLYFSLNLQPAVLKKEQDLKVKRPWSQRASCVIKSDNLRVSGILP